jgi:hypothetical protein
MILISFIDNLYDINFQLNGKFYKIQIYYNSIDHLRIMNQMVHVS